LSIVEKACVELDIKLGPIEETERDDVEPEEERDPGTERAVDLGVVGETGDIPAEDDGREEPHGGGEEGPGEGPFPGLLHRGTHVIDESCDADAARESDDPAKKDRKEVDRGSSRG